jgi:hypothetical protein
MARTENPLDALAGNMPTEAPDPFATMAAADAPASNFQAANKQLQLTPQEQFLYQMHLNNLAAGGVSNPAGGTSTLFVVTFEIGGKTYVIPTVWNGQILPPAQALEMARKTGLEKFPSYKDDQEAGQRYHKMHDFMEQDLERLNTPAPGKSRSSIDGGVQLAGDVVKMPGAATPPQRVFNALKTDDLNKLTTQRTLMRALGGGADVLPIKPEDK